MKYELLSVLTQEQILHTSDESQHPLGILSSFTWSINMIFGAILMFKML